jgi:hypothetical protein
VFPFNSKGVLTVFISLRGMGQHLFQDLSSMSTLNRAIEYLYNDEFDRSVASFDTIRARYAGSVTVHLFDCLMLYWKNFPVVTHPEEYEKYRSGLLSALDQRAEALMFASYIHLRYENDVKTLYIENLIQSGSYEKALAHLDTLSGSRIAFYRLPVALFHGMLSERYYDNSAEAEYWYKKAIGSTPEPNSATGNYVGMASYGLANIYRKEGNTSDGFLWLRDERRL